jgi:GT2 family glycosyltransferase
MTIDSGWPDDLQRWRESVRKHTTGDFTMLLVGPNPRLGWARAANAALEAPGEVVILFDPGTELTGDVAPPLLAALADPTVAVAGAFGVRGKGTLKEFESHPGPEVDAIEGYCMAFRKADAVAVGGFDRKFAFYRIADIEFSFRLRDQGHRRALVVPGLPIVKHAHRLWEATPEAERARLSKKNFYRFLDRWGGREDLLTDRGDQGGGAQRHQQQAGQPGAPGPHTGADPAAGAGDRSGDGRPPGR